MHSHPWLELVTAEFGHLLLSCTRSFIADLSRGCSEARSKLILQSIKLVPASGPYDWIKRFGETVLCHRNACSYLRHQGLVQLMKLLWHLCNVLQGWYLQRMMDLTAGEGCGCFHMLLQFSPSFVTAPYGNMLFRAASPLLAAPSPSER